MTALPATTPANFTRRSKSLTKKFIREGRIHFIPLYWFLRLSDFAREGMDHSGSFRFADHLYRGVPSGRGPIGRWLDAILLKLPSSRSMRQRCFESRDAMLNMFAVHRAERPAEPFRVLTVPCGLPRDVRDFVARIAAEDPATAKQISYTGMDLDPAVIEAAQEFLKGSSVATPKLSVGNALERADYPDEAFHFIASTGLGEFLNDADLARFYQNVFETLAPGGTFFTSAANAGRATKPLLEAMELRANYRASEDLQKILALQPWASLEITHDSTGLQTFVRGRKPL